MAMAGTIGAPSSEERGLDLRNVTTVTAAAIAIADMIGIGVFTSLGFQVQGIPSPFSVIMLWVVGGIAALCGALSYGELAAALPRSGGEYNFLSHIYGRSIGFVAGWISATVGFAAPVALAAMAFSGYFDGVVPGIVGAATVNVFSYKVSLVPIAVVWLIGLVHLNGVALGSTFHNFATGLKLTLIVVLIFAGLALGTAQPISFAPSAADLNYITGAPFAVGLVFVMYAYSGWNAATYIAGEIHNPQRSLPLAILAATLIVITLYVGLNAVFLYTTPIDQMAGQVEVALIAGKHIFGDVGGRLVGALICLGLISSISAMIWIGPRVTQVMGEDIPMMRVFAKTSRTGVPAVAIIFQLCVTTLLMATRSFESVLDYIQFSLTFCSFLAVLGVIVLRVREPGLKRPYRMWGYPFTPAVFLAVTTFMMYYLIIERPWQSLASVATMLAGLLVYGFSLTQAPAGAKTESSIDG
jgi:basic amino acid/polyamine antiporter, APA family